MDQLACTPKFAADDATASQEILCPRPGCASVGADLFHRSRICPDGAPVAFSVIEDLRAKVRAIEQHTVGFDPSDAAVATSEDAWTLGAEPLDRLILGGLDPHGVHEVKPDAGEGVCAAASRAVSLGFTARLAVRRIAGLIAEHSTKQPSTKQHRDALIVWCWPASLAQEIGRRLRIPFPQGGAI